MTLIIVEDDSRDWSSLLSLSTIHPSLTFCCWGDCWYWCYNVGYKIFTILHTNWFDNKKWTIFISFHYSKLFTEGIVGLGIKGMVELDSNCNREVYTYLLIFLLADEITPRVYISTLQPLTRIQCNDIIWLKKWFLVLGYLWV